MDMWIIYLLGGLALLGWLAPLLDQRLSGWRPQYLQQVPAEGPEPLPRLSVIVPALNEEETVERAMRTLLALDYPDLEIIAVDDRSTDQTGAILDRLAADDPRLRVVHVSELPSGWLGKNHALHLGGRHAAGEFLLFTDADVHFEPSALRRAVRYALHHRIDHLTLFPQVILHGFRETVMVWFFGLIFSFKFRPWRISDPKSRAFLGVGAFNLVRAEVYRQVGGHAALKMDVADDVKLGKRMKESGGRAACLLGGEMVKVRWIVGLKGIVVGLTKNMFAGFHYRPIPALIASGGLFVLATWPLIGLLVGPWFARLLCLLSLTTMVAAATVASPTPRSSPLYALGFPLAALVVIYIIYRSMLFTYRQGGIVWRGTLYPLEELRRGVA